MKAGLRILVVDDDWPMAKTLVDVLKLNGYQAEAAYSGPEALQLMERDRFDCVLTDIKMPDVNGVELLRAIKDTRPDVPVVFMTAYADSDLVRAGLREGAIASFVKPLDIDLLLWLLSELSEQRSIVIVDDDTKYWRTVEESLEQRGFVVREASDPDGLMEMLSPSRQVVFLGGGLNGTRGLDLLKRIREQHDTLPVVLATDEQGQTVSEVEEARGLNVHACMQKPFQTEDLLEVLADIRQRELSALLPQRPHTLVSQTIRCC